MIPFPDGYPLPTRDEQPEPDNVPPSFWPEESPHFMLGRAAVLIEKLLNQPGDDIIEGCATDWLTDYRRYMEADDD